MSYTNRISEELYPLATHYPLQRQVATHVSDWVSLRDYHRAWLKLDVGVMGALGTVDAGLQQATDITGTGAKAIAGKTITQLTQAGGDDNSQVCIELQTEELDVDNGFDCVRFYVVVGVQESNYNATLYGAYPRFKPVPTTNWDEIVG